MSWFYTSIPLTQAWGSLLAGGILEVRGINGWGGWQWLYGSTYQCGRWKVADSEAGMICIVIGIVAFFFISPSITQPASAFKRSDGTNKWWTEKEELILVNRLLRDDPTKGDLNNRTAVSLKETLRTIIAPDLLPIYIVCQRPH
jgi:MFS family permease